MSLRNWLQSCDSSRDLSESCRSVPTTSAASRPMSKRKSADAKD